MAEHTKVFEVVIGEDRYYISSSASHHLQTNLNNYNIKYDSLIETKKKVSRVGTSLFLGNSLQRAITISELKKIVG